MDFAGSLIVLIIFSINKKPAFIAMHKTIHCLRRDLWGLWLQANLTGFAHDLADDGI